MSSKAAHKSRYFINDLPDYKGKSNSEVKISKEFLQINIKTLLSRIIDCLPATINNADGGIYVGCTGIAFTLYKILMLHCQDNSTLSLSKTQVESYLKASQTYLEVSLLNLDKIGCAPDAGFILGNAGVNAISACFYTFLQAFNPDDKKLTPKQINEYTDISARCLRSFSSAADSFMRVDVMDCGSDELFIGRAGYLCGLYFLEKQFKQKIVSDDVIKKLLEAMLTSGRQYSSRAKIEIPLMYAYYQTEYLGAAHGLCAILQMMLNYLHVLEKIPNGVRDVRASIDALVGLQWRDGNFAPTLEEVSHSPDESSELVHWCHGAPGVVYLMAKAYLVFQDEKYLKSALLCGEVTWTKGLLKKGPGLCHGVAGNAYVFLTLYRLLKCQEPKWLHRAIQFAHFIFSPKFQGGSRTPDCPYSLYEGVSGTVCLLADLLTPEKAQFPFFDIFDS